MTTANDFQIRKVPTDYAWLYFQAAWRLVKKNYPVIMAVSVFMLLTNMILSFVPFVGPVLQPIYTGFLGFGVWTILKGMAEGQPVTFEQIFLGFKDREFMKRVIPFIVANAIFSGFTMLLNWMGTQAGTFASLGISFSLVVLMIGWLVLTTFALPLIIFKKMPFVQTIELSFSAFTKNVAMFFVQGLVMIGLGMLSMLLLILPFFFIFLPVLITTQYLIYASIFEGLAVEGIQ